MSEELLTSKEWQELTCLDTIILDPDGWDRVNYQYSFFEELITGEEFFRRFSMSTVIFHNTKNNGK